MHLEGIVRQSSAKTFNRLVFCEMTALVETAAVLPPSGDLTAVQLCT